MRTSLKRSFFPGDFEGAETLNNSMSEGEVLVFLSVGLNFSHAHSLRASVKYRCPSLGGSLLYLAGLRRREGGRSRLLPGLSE